MELKERVVVVRALLLQDVPQLLEVIVLTCERAPLEVFNIPR